MTLCFKSCVHRYESLERVPGQDDCYKPDLTLGNALNSLQCSGQTHGIPAMTFEVGDNMPPEATRAASIIFAQEMMTLLLDGLP